MRELSQGSLVGISSTDVAVPFQATSIARIESTAENDSRTRLLKSLKQDYSEQLERVFFSIHKYELFSALILMPSFDLHFWSLTLFVLLFFHLFDASLHIKQRLLNIFYTLRQIQYGIDIAF